MINHMPIRARIVVQGWVQKVGFRSLVTGIAWKFGINGFVRNLKDRRFVEIVCEAEKGKTEEFVQIIKKNAISPVRIDDVKIEYSKPTGEFERFEDIRGDIQEEMFESLEAGMQHMQAMRKDLSGQMDTGFSGLGEKMDTGFSGLKTEMKNGSSGVRTEIRTNFNRLDQKYDVFSQRMIEITKKMDETNRSINETNKTHGKLLERISTLVEEFIRQGWNK